MPTTYSHPGEKQERLDREEAFNRMKEEANKDRAWYDSFNPVKIIKKFGELPEALQAIGRGSKKAMEDLSGTTAMNEAAEEQEAAYAEAGDRSLAEFARQYNLSREDALRLYDEGKQRFEENLGTAEDYLNPYMSGGLDAYNRQLSLSGVHGRGAQEAAIQGIANSPEMQAMVQQGEQGILQNAAATGGLRGGNTQSALAQFRPQVLSQLIDRQLGRYGGIAGAGLSTATNLSNLGMGQAAQLGAAGQGLSSQLSGLGQGYAGNVANVYGQQAQAKSASAQARAQAQADMWGGIGRGAVTLGSMALFGPWGGAAAHAVTGGMGGGGGTGGGGSALTNPNFGLNLNYPGF